MPATAPLSPRRPSRPPWRLAPRPARPRPGPAAAPGRAGALLRSLRALPGRGRRAGPGLALRIAAGLAGVAFAGPAAASVCQSVAGILPDARLVRFAQAEGTSGKATLRYVGHSTYLIETGGGVTIATDYSGWSGPVAIPDVVTMNHAHETHWTAAPDPAIPHALKGWGEPGEPPAAHWVQVGDALVRNVTTDIRGWGGGVEKDGNSIFIFEIGDLCIGHLGHLHHTLGPDHYAAIGRLDVVMAPVDGGATLNLPDMMAILKRVRASVVLPMHYWGYSSLDAFLDGMSGAFRVVRADIPSLTITPRTLPTEPTVFVLPQGG
ncbi:L-ascorbate metabolism protein UlaG, beta-lactamase superfamily [Albimonas donghaensis]|uniref:L-ascorbate metabolism protein UlaG, beta-lactamase superfamily n=1 Tax=Albimonas donghaensis TaxID=356660 RepID=A0A1H2WPJ6_9RHOB|nr:MBL fold metallo-hydrolase [Albimonas donghaensis]SDW82593.1 L-ascorbate metabolism protein UlaG, beta-lactamase superfamily [Albimonas donghaensis]